MPRPECSAFDAKLGDFLAAVSRFAEFAFAAGYLGGREQRTEMADPS
jgi:hypothetical protein